MNDANRLVTSPSVYVVGHTAFNQSELERWIRDRGYEQSPEYLTSPIYSLANARQLLSPEHLESEFMTEFAGRFCYDSFMKGRDTPDYIENILQMAHGSVLEHATFNMAIEGVSRSCATELIRHRAGFAISQESQRYVDAKDIRFVVPPMLLHLWGGDLECQEAKDWLRNRIADLEEYKAIQEYILSDADMVMLKMKEDYKALTSLKKRANEAARSVLPNAAETRMVWTGNIRALRHVCSLRGAEAAELEIRRLAVAIAEKMMDVAPYSFVDFTTQDGEFGVPEAVCSYPKV